MSDPSGDEIAQWADGLTPDGSPGLMQQRMREYFGDTGAERVLAQNEATNALYLQKQNAIANLLSLAVVYGIFFGMAAYVAFVAFVVKYIF